MDIFISMTGSNLSTKFKFGFIWGQTELWEKQETKEHQPETRLSTPYSSWWTVSDTTSHRWGVLVWFGSSMMPLQQHHIWGLCKAQPQGLLGFMWLFLGFLSGWQEEQGCAVGSDWDFLGLFGTLCQGMVLREYRVWKASVWPWNSWEYSQSFWVFPLQLPISNTDGQRVIDLCYYTRWLKFDFSYKRDMILPLWSNNSGGGENLWLREASFHNW